MAPAYAADDGAALHFVGDEVAQVVASRPEARAYRVELRHGHVVTTQLATRYLGDDAFVPLVRRDAGAGRSVTTPDAVPLRGRTILALGGHEFSRKRGNEAIRDYMLALADATEPRVCLLPTASGDPAEQIAAFRAQPRRPPAASSPTSPCSGSRPSRSTSSATCSPRT